MKKTLIIAGAVVAACLLFIVVRAIIITVF